MDARRLLGKHWTSASAFVQWQGRATEVLIARDTYDNYNDRMSGKNVEIPSNSPARKTKQKIVSAVDVKGTLKECFKYSRYIFRKIFIELIRSLSSYRLE